MLNIQTQPLVARISRWFSKYLPSTRVMDVLKPFAKKVMIKIMGESGLIRKFAHSKRLKEDS